MCRGAKYRYQHMPTMAINSHVYNLNTFVYFLKNIINLVNVDDTSDRIDHVRFGRACHFKSEDARGGAMHQYGAAPTLVEALLGGRYTGTLYLEDVLSVSRMLRPVRGAGDVSSRGTESQSHHRP